MRPRALFKLLLTVGLALTLGILLIALPAVVSAQGPSSGWMRVNADGFGDWRNQAILALAPFKGQLYAGTHNSYAGAQLWRRGSSWERVASNGFGDPDNQGIDHLIEFKGNLYAGTWAVGGWAGPWNPETRGGEVWRSSTGNAGDWTRVVSNGFGVPTNAEIFRFGVFSDMLYAGTWVYTYTRGTEIWRSSAGDSGDWEQVVDNGFDGDVNNLAVISFDAFNGYLYAGTYNMARTVTDTTTGGEVWRTNDGIAWTQVNADGFGTTDTLAISALAAFNERLYASTWPGCQIWRCQTCDGSDWTKVVENGFGNPDTWRESALEVFDNYLYFVGGNPTTGLEVWRSNTGNPGEWEQVGFGGFGDSNNAMPYWDNSVTVFNEHLYVGTWKWGSGTGEVWVHPTRQVHLPIILRNQ
jgi:hypothetical protein